MEITFITKKIKKISYIDKVVRNLNEKDYENFYKNDLRTDDEKEYFLHTYLSPLRKRRELICKNKKEIISTENSKIPLKYKSETILSDKESIYKELYYTFMKYYSVNRLKKCADSLRIKYKQNPYLIKYIDTIANRFILYSNQRKNKPLLKDRLNKKSKEKHTHKTPFNSNIDISCIFPDQKTVWGKDYSHHNSKLIFIASK
ncbi:MAG: hypothetical protein KBT03_07510 [Bacteroidales bacterium]|nr:hypothetical protein [Candidatus Scybalousia scybalohippi]